jgi:hypothetical protein
MVTMFPVLNGEIANRGIQRTVIARAINVSYNAFRNKMAGVSPFTFDEACTIQERFFPDMEMRILFKKSTPPS